MKPNEKLMERLPPIPEHLAIDLRQIANNLDTKAGYETLDAQQIRDAANLIQNLTPRPIEEAPKDKYFITMNDGLVKIGLYNSRLNRVLSDNSIYLTEAKSFIPLSAIQALMESGK